MITRREHSVTIKVCFRIPLIRERYLVTGLQTESVRGVFNNQVLSALASIPATKLSVEGSGTWLVVYRHTKLAVRPDTIPAFAKEAGDLAQLFLEQKGMQAAR